MEDGGNALEGDTVSDAGRDGSGMGEPATPRPGTSSDARSPASSASSLSGLALAAMAALLLWQLAAGALLLLYSAAPGCGASPSRTCVRATVVEDTASSHRLTGLDARGASVETVTLRVRIDGDEELTFYDKRDGGPRITLDNAGFHGRSGVPEGAPVMLRRWHGEYVTATVLEGHPYKILNQDVTTDRETFNLGDWSPTVLASTIGLLVPVQILLGLYALRPRVGRLRSHGRPVFVLGWCAAVVAVLVMLFGGSVPYAVHMFGVLLGT